MSRVHTIRPASWSDAEHRQLRELYPVRSTIEVAELLGRTAKAVASRAKILGIRKAVGHGGKIPWTTLEDDLIREFYPHIPTAKLARQLNRSVLSTYNRAEKFGLRKTQAYLDSPDACRLRRGDNVGAAYRFKKGQEPANKGIRRPGWGPGRMRETQFKKGNTPHTWRPVGSFRFSKDGYLQRKVSDTGYTPRDWKAVHVLLWEEKNGSVHPGHAVVFRDGDKTNIVFDNLELISRADLMRRNTIHNLPPALKEVMQLTGAINRQITMRGRRAEEQDQRSA